MSALEALGSPRLAVRSPGGAATMARVTGPGPVELGALTVTLEERADGWGWSVANAGGDPVALECVRLEWDAGPLGGDARMLRHGYQSWSPTGVARIGVDRDPSATPGSIGLVRGMHHADSAVVADPHELRSELVTVLALTPGSPLVGLGFDAGAGHDGTFRVRPDTGRVAVAAEAHLGGAVLAPGAERRLHGVTVDEGDDASLLLEAWAARAGQAGGARTGAPYQVGWCSWYHYFHDVTEAALRANLARSAGWPFDVFQLDDGWQRHIGDWLATNDRFPSTLPELAGSIAAEGRRPGIWLAPFLASPGSELAAAHPDWLARWDEQRPLVGMVNPGWGGAVHTLDTTRPEVLAHIEHVAAELVAAGFTYLKLDFTYAPSLPGRFHDPARTPAERVRAGMEAVRRGAGPDAFLLGCGLPLGAGIGVVDGMRIGPDVAPHWEVRPDQWVPPGYDGVEPATRNAWRNTLSRSFQHRRLWLNDPDCLMLRAAETDLSPDAARVWALAVGVSGGMALVSDDLALLDGGARRLLDEVLALGRAADAEAASGRPPRCDDLLESDPPTRLTGGGARLVVDLTGPRATISR